MFVYDAQNNMAMETERGCKVKGASARMSHLGGMFWLDPGESRKEELAVSDLFDMSRPEKMDHLFGVCTSNGRDRPSTIAIRPFHSETKFRHFECYGD